MKNQLLTATLAIALYGPSINADNLKITVTNIKENTGSIGFIVFDKETWLSKKNIKLEHVDVTNNIKAGSITHSMNIPAGEFALSVYHDVNGNSKLDTKAFIPIPKEPNGFSNGYVPKMIPKFEDAKIQLSLGTTNNQTIVLSD